MRLIPIDFTQVNLFGKKMCNESASFFRKHKESYKRMIVEQGRHFWIYFSVSFKSYCLNNGIIEIAGISSDMKFTQMVEEVLEVTDQMLTNGHVKDGITLCEDLITVFQYRSFIDEIQSQSIMTNPFYMRDSEDTFRRLFGKPMEDKTLHLIKVVKTLQFLLHLGGCLFEMLRKWLQAEECKQDVTLYWKPPPEKPFHLFGENSPTLKKACTVINKYEQALLDKTMYQLQEDTREGRNLINIQFENNSEDSGDDDPEKLRYKSKKLSIVIENEDTKEVKKKVKLKYPRWETSSYELDPKECPGCRDHLECIRKQVIDQGFVLPEIFEVHYEPNFHVKIRHCSHCNVRMHDCDGPSHHNTGKSLRIAGAKRKDKGLTRTALKQMAKKERRIQRKEMAGKESLDKLETKGLQKFVDECRKVPGFIEELERMKPKKLVGVPLPEQLVEAPKPNPNAGVCRWRILDDDGNEVDTDEEKEIMEERKRMKNAGEDKESKDEENEEGNKVPQVAEDKERDIKQGSEDKVMTEIKEEPPKEEDQPAETESIVKMKQEDQVPEVANQPAQAGCCIVENEGSPVDDDDDDDDGTPVDRPEDYPVVKAKEFSDSVDAAMPNESIDIKNHKLRVCGLCGKQEAKPKTYKKCQECRQQKIKQGKYYCSRDCQVQDWKWRHCKEHLERDREAEMTQWKGNNNNELSMDERLAILDLNKAALLNDVE